MGMPGRIKQVRGRLTQDDFAKTVKTSKITVGRWERGERMPGGEDLQNILAAFPNITASWLLTGNGQMTWSSPDFKPVPVDSIPIPKPGDNPKPLDVSEEMLERITSILNEKMGDRKAELTMDKMMALSFTLYRIYSKNFLESEAFRQDTMEIVIGTMVKFLLSEKG